jgi:hypothetical protein
MATAAIALATVAVLSAWVAPAAAVAPRDGWGFAIADDDWDWDDPGRLPSLDEGFAELAPKAFRFQMIWNATDFPWHLDRARGLIGRARAQGVEQIVVTFKKSVEPDVDPVYGRQPSADGYAEHVGEAVRLLADEVDVWGAANEPNRGETWLPGVPGAQLLAQYQRRLEQAVATWDPTAETTSPDFVDRTDLGTIGAYVNAYENAGGGWGDHVAWHPYWGANAETTATTLDLIGLAPTGADVWITEVGAFGRSESAGIEATETAQNDHVWWLADTLAALPQVERVHYYHMRGSPTATWDTGLMDVDGSRRMAWHTWCAMARGDVGHPACEPVTPRSAAPPAPPPPAAPPIAGPSAPPLVQLPLPSAGSAPTSATDGRPAPAAPDVDPPTVRVDRVPRRLAYADFADGIAPRVRVDERSDLRVALLVTMAQRPGARPRSVALARLMDGVGAGARRLRLVPRLRPLADRRDFVVRLRVSATDAAGNRSVAVRRLRVR